MVVLLLMSATEAGVNISNSSTSSSTQQQQQQQGSWQHHTLYSAGGEQHSCVPLQVPFGWLL
jgi:hypothetical protein